MLGECLLISSLPGKALRTLADIAMLAEILIILSECLLISIIPDKALRTLVDMARPAEVQIILGQCLLISSLPNWLRERLLTSRGLLRYREY